MYEQIIQRALRVPRSDGPLGDGSAVARQLDAVLLGVGFSASRALLEHVSCLAPGPAMDLASRTVVAVRGLVGDHVQHNSYFINFPHGVPDTVDFWVGALRAALVPAGSKADDSVLREMVFAQGFNLLDLPTYGNYQHTYAELLAAHDALIETAGDRVTVLHLGGSLAEETQALYLTLAESKTPLGEADLELLAQLAEVCADGAQPEAIPVRENRAALNAARLVAGRPLVAVDTVTDVLRVACAASGGDVSLVEPTKFRSFRRAERRVLLRALHDVVDGDANKLGDVARFAERWKRLAVGLHLHDYPQYPAAQIVFDVARRDLSARSVAGRFEFILRGGRAGTAAAFLAKAAPGMMLRALDRLLRTADATEVEEIVASAEVALKSASGRVLCSLREHLVNRATPDASRVFVGRSRRAWVASDDRQPLSEAVISRLVAAIDVEMEERLPAVGHLVVDPAVFDVALPLSGKATADGFAVLPRGSRSWVDPKVGDTLRFFVYWKQTEQRTDFDLSALLLDAEFGYAGQVSFTNYRESGVTHSGDLTEARNGASEFIDVRLSKLHPSVRYIVPQVNVYAGEGFDEVEESLFGWMQRDRAQKGVPFEPRTVRMRSEMRGKGRVALPMVFARADAGWSALWSHLYLRGNPAFNQVEGNRLSTARLMRGIVERRYLTMGYLVDLLGEKAGEFSLWTPELKLAGPVTFVGREVPETLPNGSVVFAADRFSELIPG